MHSEAELAALLNKYSVLFVLSYHPSDRLSYDAFLSAAEALKLQARFASWEQTVQERSTVSKYESNRKAFSMHMEEGAMTAAEGPMSVDGITRFVETHNHLLVNPIDKDNFRLLGRTGKPLVLAIVDYQQEAAASDVIIALDEAASELDVHDAHRLIFGHMDGVRWRKFLGKYEASVPSILVIDLSVNGYYVQKVLDTAAVQRLVASALSKELEYHEVEHPDASILQRIQRKMQRGYPWSVLICVLPVLFLLVSAMFPHPASRKAKND